MPAFLGGYFSAVAIASAPPFIILGGWRAFLSLNPVTIAFFVILFLSLLISGFSYFFGVPLGYSNEMLRWSIVGVMLNFSLFLLGYFIPLERKWIYFSLLFVMFLIVVSNVGHSGIFDLRRVAQVEVIDSVSSYQGIGRSILVVSIFSLAITFGKSSLFYPSVFFSLVALFLNGARTEFLLYVFAVIFIHGFYIIKDSRVFLRVLFLIFVGFLSILAFSELVPVSRMFQLADVFSSSSVQARGRQFVFSINEVFGSIEGGVLGSYGAYTSLGGVGHYPHNIFSAWVNLGFLGFLLYILVLFVMWISVFGLYREMSESSLYKAFVCFLVCITIALIFSKDYSYILVGLTVGLHAQLRALKANKERASYL